MFEHLFRQDNVVFRIINTIGYVWYLNLLWVITSLPIITIGASTSALIYSCLKLRRQEGYVTSNYFKSFKENFRQSTVLFLLTALAGGILAADLVLTNQLSGEMRVLLRIVTYAVILPYTMTILYVFAVQAQFVNSIKRTIEYSFALAMKHFGWTLQMALLVGAVVYLNCCYLIANYLTLSIGAGFLAYFLSAYYRKIFDQYIPQEENAEL